MEKLFRLQAFEIKLSEVQDTIQLFRVGNFTHPEYGDFKITSEFLAEIKQNFDNKVRGIDIAIDYKHASEDIAAGWLKEITLSDDGRQLFGKVDWTPNGQKVISEKEFRYISPEFSFNYKDNESLKNYGATLLGAGLTNRPVIKKMEPVIELMEKPKPKERVKMDDQKQMSPEEMMKLIEELKAELAKVKGEHASMMEEKKCAEKKAEFVKLLAEGKACAAQEDSYIKGDMKTFIEKAQSVKMSEKGTSTEPKSNTTGIESVDDKIIALADKLLTEKKAKTLSEAYEMVLRENKELLNEKYN